VDVLENAHWTKPATRWRDEKLHDGAFRSVPGRQRDFFADRIENHTYKIQDFVVTPAVDG